MNLIPSSQSCQRTTKVVHFSLAIAVAKWSMKGDTFSCSHSPWPLIKENISRACPLLLFGEKQVNQHSSFWIALHYVIHSVLPNIFVLSPKTCGEKCWSPEGPQAFSESLSILSICSYISKVPAGKDLQSLSSAWYCSTRRLLEEQERQSGLKCQELEGYTYLYISLLSDTASFRFVSALLQGACGFTAGRHCLSQERCAWVSCGQGSWSCKASADTLSDICMHTGLACRANHSRDDQSQPQRLWSTWISPQGIRSSSQ